MGTKRFLADVTNAVEGQCVRLDAEESEHACRVLRLRAGDAIRVFDGRGAEFEAEIVQARRDAVVCRLIRQAAPAAETSVPVTLAFGLPKKNAMEWIAQKAVELGAARLAPFVSERTVVHPADAGHAAQRWARIIRDATKQCGRARLCALSPLSTWRDIVAGAPEGACRLMCWEAAPSGAPRLAECLAQADARTARQGIWIAVGPEGGFAPGEIALARQSGWTACSLGPRILRAETAVIVAMVAALHSLGDL